MPDLAISLHNPHWEPVYTLPSGTMLPKGRKNEWYKDIREATRKVNQRFGCYVWGNTTTVWYCGSFAQDYARKEFQTNLEGRVHNYLQNHRVDAGTGRINTNKMVFDKLNERLLQEEALLQVLVFDSLVLGTTVVSFATFSNDSDLVHTVEQLVICTYRRQGECQWNRT